MEIHKQFSFVGNLRKLNEDDDQPIENFSAGIQCCKNGSIFLEIDSEIYEKLSHKKFHESAPIYEFVDPPKFTEDEIASPFFFLQLDRLEKKLVQEPYQVDYIIEGETIEKWILKAEIAEPSFPVTFKNEDSTETESLTQKYFVRLRNLCVDYHPRYYTKSRTIEVTYGLANLDLIQNVSTKFLDLKHELNLIPLSNADNRNPESLSAEMVLRTRENNSKEIFYDTYFAWFELLISFATGKCLKEIYRIEIGQSGNSKKRVEFWSGSQTFIKGNGVAVIQQVHLSSFIQQCASKITWDNFNNRGLGSALRWYVEAFSSDTISVQFLLLCTCLETLKKHHNPNSKGTFKSRLKEVLEFYKVPYGDLFPSLEFIEIRNKIIHEGFGGSDVFRELRKLGNLVVRIILSILEYRGNYIESRKIEIKNRTDLSKYGLAYKAFPDEELLTDLNLEELQALATNQLDSSEQAQLSELLTQNANDQLSPDATAILDRLLAQVDDLNILKTRARYTLQQLYGVSM